MCELDDNLSTLWNREAGHGRRLYQLRSSAKFLLTSDYIRKGRVVAGERRERRERRGKGPHGLRTL